MQKTNAPALSMCRINLFQLSGNLSRSRLQGKLRLCNFQCWMHPDREMIWQSNSDALKSKLKQMENKYLSPLFVFLSTTVRWHFFLCRLDFWFFFEVVFIFFLMSSSFFFFFDVVFFFYFFCGCFVFFFLCSSSFFFFCLFCFFFEVVFILIGLDESTLKFSCP